MIPLFILQKEMNELAS